MLMRIFNKFNKKGFSAQMVAIMVAILVFLIITIIFIKSLGSQGQSIGDGFINFFRNLFGSG